MPPVASLWPILTPLTVYCFVVGIFECLQGFSWRSWFFFEVSTQGAVDDSDAIGSIDQTQTHTNVPHWTFLTDFLCMHSLSVDTTALFLSGYSHTATWATGGTLHDVSAYSDYGLKNAYDMDSMHIGSLVRSSSPSLPRWSCLGNYGQCLTFISSYKRPHADRPRIADYFVTSLLHPRNCRALRDITPF